MLIVSIPSGFDLARMTFSGIWEFTPVGDCLLDARVSVFTLLTGVDGHTHTTRSTLLHKKGWKLVCVITSVLAVRNGWKRVETGDVREPVSGIGLPIRFLDIVGIDDRPVSQQRGERLVERDRPDRRFVANRQTGLFGSNTN